MKIIEKTIAHAAKVLNIEADELQLWLDQHQDITPYTQIQLLRLASKHLLDPLSDEISIMETKEGFLPFITIDGWAKLMNQHPQYAGMSLREPSELNSQLPDATIELNNPILTCNSREITIDYTVSNLNCTEVLQANTPITFYIGNEIIRTIYTQNSIPIGGSENNTISLLIPNTIPLEFRLTAVVDDTGNGTGIVRELIENNNSAQIGITLIISPTFNEVENIKSCNLGFTRGIFDFSNYENLIKTNPNDLVSFYESNSNAIAAFNPILNTSSYEAQTTPKEIFVRIENENCFEISLHNLK